MGGGSKPSRMAMARSIEDHMRMLEMELTQIPADAREMLLERLYGTIHPTKQNLDSATANGSQQFTAAIRATYQDVHGFIPEWLQEGSLFEGFCLNGVFVETVTNCLKPDGSSEDVREESSRNSTDPTDQSTSPDRTNGNENANRGSEEQSEEKDEIEFDEENSETLHNETSPPHNHNQARATPKKPNGSNRGTHRRDFFAMMEKAVAGFHMIKKENILLEKAGKLKSTTTKTTSKHGNKIVTTTETVQISEEQEDDDFSDEEPEGPQTPQREQPSPARRRHHHHHNCSTRSEASSMYSYPRRAPPPTCRNYGVTPFPCLPSEPSMFWNIFVDIRLAFDANNHVINAITGKDLGTLMEFVTEACSPYPVPNAVMEKVSDLELRLRNSKDANLSRQTSMDPRMDIGLDQKKVKRNKKKRSQDLSEPIAPLDIPGKPRFSAQTPSSPPFDLASEAEDAETEDDITYTMDFEEATGIQPDVDAGHTLYRLTGESMEVLSINDSAVPQQVRDAAMKVKRDIANGTITSATSVTIESDGQLLPTMVVKETVVVQRTITDAERGKAQKKSTRKT